VPWGRHPGNSSNDEEELFCDFLLRNMWGTRPLLSMKLMQGIITFDFYNICSTAILESIMAQENSLSLSNETHTFLCGSWRSQGKDLQLFVARRKLMRSLNVCWQRARNAIRKTSQVKT
jgi:hypothetical protein